MGSGLTTGILVLLALLILLELYMITNLNSKMRRLRKRYDHLLRGRGEMNIEQVLVAQNDELEENRLRMEQIEQLVGQTSNKGILSLQKVGTYHYNAFDNTNNNLSFTLVMLDSFNNGIMITNIFGRESSVTYLKDVKSGKVEQTISEEEDEALKRALQGSRA